MSRNSYPRLILTLSLLGACGRAEAPEFRLGLVSVVTGPMGPVSGIPGQNGAALAVEELNAAGGVMIGGVAHRVVLVERTIETRADAAATATRALINVDSVDAVIGPQISVMAAAAATVAEVSQVPMISPMASNPSVTAGKSMVFRLAFLDEVQGTILAQFAFDSLRLRRAVGLFDAANPYGRDIWKLFRDTFVARGGRIVGEETFHTDAGEDYRPQLRRLLALHPDAIVLPNYSVYDTVQVRQARELGFRGRFLGSDSWDPLAMTAIDAAVGSVVVANWDHRAGGPATIAFVEKYKRRFGNDPRTTAAATYDAIRLVADAATRAGTLDGRAIAAQIRSTASFDGVVTRYRFVGTGDPVRGGVVLEILRGEAILRFVDTPLP